MKRFIYRHNTDGELASCSKEDIYKLFDVPWSTGRYFRASKSDRLMGKKCLGRKAKLDKQMVEVVEDWLDDNGYPARATHWDDIC